MRRGMLIAGIVWMAGVSCHAAGQVAPLAPDAAVDTVLDALDQRGQGLKDFQAKLSDTSGDVNLGNPKTRTGHIWFQKRAEDSRVRVLFDTRIDGKLAIPEKREYLLDGPWLTDRNYDAKTEVKRQVLKTGEKMNLLKLGEGPFPLPIGQKKEDVHRLFDVKKVAPAKGDPANSIHLLLTPKDGTDLAKKFSSIDTWIDLKTAMPIRIETLNASQEDLHSVELQDIQVNHQGGLTDGDFSLPEVDNNWSRRTEAYGK